MKLLVPQQESLVIPINRAQLKGQFVCEITGLCIDPASGSLTCVNRGAIFSRTRDLK